ncbi:hypothetical protein QE250_10885 [Chromatiaceae bacterium AAb-1]|nr:hypothetical protein [Chromatiaceae bacterium AAb-1]
MKKSLIIIGIVVVLGGGGWLYANQQAVKVIEQQIELANQAYRDMADDSMMPLIQLGYESVSANVLTKRYSIRGLELSMGSVGAFIIVDTIDVTGVELHGLADKGSLQFKGARLADAMLANMPSDISELAGSIVLHGDYDYQYADDSARLVFRQNTGINDEFSLSYQFTFSDIKALWDYARSINELTTEEKQSLMLSDSYIETIVSKLSEAAIDSGELVLVNNGFIERVMTLAQAYTAPMAVIQDGMVENLQQNQELPAAIRDELIKFVRDPKKLRLTFRFDEPLRFEQLQDDSFAQQFIYPQQFLEFANIQVEAN